MKWAPRTWLLLALGVSACREEAARPAETYVIRGDGVDTVSNVLGDPVPTCAVDSLPRLDIGGQEAAEEYPFHRMFDAATLSDGRIAVLDQGSDQIRLYDRGGRFLHAFGRRGGGPGEFRDIIQLWARPGDTLIVSDYRPFRVSWFLPDGEFIRSVEPQPVTPNNPRVQDLFADGSFLSADHDVAIDRTVSSAG